MISFLNYLQTVSNQFFFVVLREDTLLLEKYLANEVELLLL